MNLFFIFILDFETFYRYLSSKSLAAPGERSELPFFILNLHEDIMNE